MEISHRSKDFQPVVDEAVALVKELLSVPEGYSVLFLGGGASLQFCMICLYINNVIVYFRRGCLSYIRRVNEWERVWKINIGKVAPMASKKMTVKVTIPFEKNISIYLTFKSG